MTDYSIGSIAKIRVSSLSFQPANWWVGTFEQVSSGHLEPSSRTARCVVDSISTPSHLRQGIAFSDMPRLSRKAWIVAHCAGTTEPCSESSPPLSFPTGPVLRGGALDRWNWGIGSGRGTTTIQGMARMPFIGMTWYTVP